MEIFFFGGGLGNFPGNMTFEVKEDKRSISVYHSCPQVCVMFAVVSFNKSPTENSSTMGVWDSKHWERFDSHIILKKNEIQSNHYGQDQLNSEIKCLLTGCKISSNSFGLFFQFLGLFEKGDKMIFRRRRPSMTCTPVPPSWLFMPRRGFPIFERHQTQW